MSGGRGQASLAPNLMMIKIEIDNKTYRIDFSVFPPSAMKRIEELKRQIENGNVDAAYESLALLTGAEMEIINKLDVWQIAELYNAIANEAKEFVRLHSH